jgi:hypothetical protein
VQATTPAAGHDWSFVVPGQWTATLIGITATLVTGPAVTTLPDETGNGHTATLVAGNLSVAGAQGPYAAGAANYAVFGPGTFASADQYASAGASAAFSVAAGTIECLINLPTHVTGLSEGNGWGVMDNGGTIVRLGLGTDISSVADPAPLQLVSNGAFRAIVGGGTVSRNVWHSLALTWDGITFAIYIDGVAAGTHAGDMPAWALPFPFLASTVVNNPHYGLHASDAYYGAALTPAQLQTHFNARGSWTAYRAAVLADTPVAFWGLNTVVSGPSRKVDLRITDGTRIVGEYPANFPATTAPAFIWSWQVLGSGALSTTDGTTNTVPIPAMTLPAGYVIGSNTLDLAGTDRWGPITLWFDDGTGPGGPGGGGAGESGYLNALLVPDYSHRSI